MKILIFFNTRVQPEIKKKKDLFSKAVLAGLGAHAEKPGETSLIFTGDEEIKKINAKFLKKKRLTDVIAFKYSPEHLGDKPTRQLSAPVNPFGDIFVCAGQAGRQAGELGHSLLEELLTLSVHGALHLAGMGDNTPRKRAAMQAQTDKILGKLGIVTARKV